MDKEKILEMAEKQFFAKHYSDVKLDNVANALDIKKPSLYYYFQDKKDLFFQTLKYSMDKYMKALKEIVNRNSIDEFISWYLTFPTKESNLFAIAFQKWIWLWVSEDSVILMWKVHSDKIIEDFLRKYDLSKVKTYLIISMLNRLAQENCIDWYCLKFSVQDIKNEIINMVSCWG